MQVGHNCRTIRKQALSRITGSDREHRPVEVFMDIFLIVLAILLVVAGVVLLAYYKRPASARHKRRPPASSIPARPGGIDKLQGNDLFWGVELTQAGCESSHILLRKQFTFEAAPELPLEGCSSAACTCQYRGLRERRSRIRRTHPDRREELRYDTEKPNRRARVSRRRADKWADHTY